MTYTKKEPGPYDGLEKAKDDEPIFTLIGSDPFAPATIYFWVELARNAARNIEDDDKRRYKLIQCVDAEELAWEMDRWRKGIPSSDTRLGLRGATYSGYKQSAADLDNAARIVEIRKGLSFFREAAYYATEGRDLMIGLDNVLNEDDISILTEAVKAINEVADRHEIKRTH